MRKPFVNAFPFQDMADFSPPVSPQSTTVSSPVDIKVRKQTRIRPHKRSLCILQFYANYVSILQESGQLDQRTSAAVESLLSLSRDTSAREEMQWRPPSPASSISTESATFSPTRPDPVESTSTELETDQCGALPVSPDVAQSSGAMVSPITYHVSILNFVPFRARAAVFVYVRHART